MSSAAYVERWEAFLDWLHAAVPATAARLNPPADEAAIAELEAVIGHLLPEAVRAGWHRCDGEQADVKIGAIFGFEWLSVSSVLRHWRDWEYVRASNVGEDMATLRMFATSQPDGAIQAEYTDPGWIPLFRWPLEGDYVGIDFAPGAKGAAGQIISFGRDVDDKQVLAPDFDTLLGWLASEATSGRTRPTDGLKWHPDGTLIAALGNARL